MTNSIRRILSLCALGFAMSTLVGCQPEATGDPSAARLETGAPQDLEQSPEMATQPSQPESASMAEATVPADREDSTADRSQPSESPAPLLGIGDPAPALSIDQWVMGKPLDQLQAGQVYVVEFWATWCPPCRTSMPHLSSLQQQYGEAIGIVGVTRESESVVSRFLEKEQSEETKWSEVIKYRLAIDQNDATSNAYMRAAQQSGIPTAFIVGRDGIIEWIGHPMSMDQPLEQVVDGSWDRSAAVAEFKSRQALTQLSRELSVLQRSGKHDEALEKLVAIEELLGKSASLLNAKLRLLLAADRQQEASQTRAEIVELAWDEPMQLNELAWNTAISGDQRDIELALRAAKRASELTQDENGAILDTLARVYYEQGDVAQALQWQRKAVEHGDGNPGIEKTLKKYEAEIEAE